MREREHEEGQIHDEALEEDLEEEEDLDQAQAQRGYYVILRDPAQRLEMALEAQGVPIAGLLTQHVIDFKRTHTGEFELDLGKELRVRGGGQVLIFDRHVTGCMRDGEITDLTGVRGSLMTSGGRAHREIERLELVDEDIVARAGPEALRFKRRRFQ